MYSMNSSIVRNIYNCKKISNRFETLKYFYWYEQDEQKFYIIKHKLTYKNLMKVRAECSKAKIKQL